MRLGGNPNGWVDTLRRFDTVETTRFAMHKCVDLARNPTDVLSRRQWNKMLLFPAFLTFRGGGKAMAISTQEQEVLERRKRMLAQKKEDLKKKADEKQKEEQFKSDQLERRKEKARQRMRKLQEEGS